MAKVPFTIAHKVAQDILDRPFRALDMIFCQDDDY